jgi:FeS assembly SUF system protein
MTETERKIAEDAIVEALKTVFDPEIPVDIYELGLIYAVVVREDGQADITMTLTSPLCPVAGSLPFDVKQKAESVDGVVEANVELTFEPPWTQDRMSEVAKLELGML